MDRAEPNNKRSGPSKDSRLPNDSHGGQPSDIWGYGLP